MAQIPARSTKWSRGKSSCTRPSVTQISVWSVRVRGWGGMARLPQMKACSGRSRIPACRATGRPSRSAGRIPNAAETGLAGRLQQGRGQLAPLREWKVRSLRCRSGVGPP
ncbi:hypothetical protein ACFSYD_13290 [Paracoccus aerius]